MNYILPSLFIIMAHTSIRFETYMVTNGLVAAGSEIYVYVVMICKYRR